MDDNQPRTYCLDTSSLLEAWSRSYRIANFPSFWARMERLVKEGRSVICEEVRTEVEQNSTGLLEWVKAQTGLIVEFDRRQEQMVQRIMHDYPKLVNLKKNKGWADPFVIALAETRGLVVVTEETFGELNGPRIPLVCNACDVPCIKLIDLIEHEGWVF